MSIAVEAAIQGKQIMWGAPTFDQVRVGWDETIHAANKVANFTQQRMMATFPNGGRIIYRSLDDPDNARGHTADGVIIDEAADVKEQAWYEVLRPMLMDTNGFLWAIGTPKGRNWYWREHENSQDRNDSQSWQIPTLGCEIVASGLARKPHPFENPNVPFEEIEHLHKTTPERIFRQEILAEFIEDTGGIFRRVREAAIASEQSKAISNHQYIMGVDWGKHNDFTVISVMDLTTNSLASIDRFNQIDYQLQLKRLLAQYERFQPALIIAESNAMGEPIIEQLRYQGLPVQPFLTTNATKAQIIDNLALAFERSTITILSNHILVTELQAYEAERLPSGLLRYSAPEGMHDDCVMSLALAWWGCSQSPTGGIFV